MRRALGAALAATLAGCAQVPPGGEGAPPEPARAPRVETPASDSAVRHAAIARHEKLAREAHAAGDLALAAEHEAVLALIDSGNPARGEALRRARAAIDAAAQEQSRVAAAARRAGDNAKAREASLRVLALDPDNAEAARTLRELEQQAMARTQADRAARARSMDDIIAGARARASTDNGADLDQRIELVRSSDASIALREARAFAEANPGDRAGRSRLAVALAERARDLEAKGQREWALPAYDLAAQLGGSAQAEAAKRAAALRRALADEAYAEGMRARNKDLTAAIRHWETALRFDPQHARAQERLREARAAQQKLERIGK